VAGDQVALADPEVELPGRLDDVEDATPLGFADKEGLSAGGAEALVFGAQHRVPRGQPGVQLGLM
jgi:hypothetical protein